MTNKEAKEKLYMEWQKFLEDNIDYAGISDAYKTAFKVLEQESDIDKYLKQIDHLHRYVSKLETQIIMQKPCGDAVSREVFEQVIRERDIAIEQLNELGYEFGEKIEEPKYCDRNICIKNEYNGIGCEDCEVTKSQEPSGDLISRQAVLEGLASIAKAKARSDAQKALMGRVMFFTEHLPPVNPQAKMGWIPVSERLPEKDMPCLVSVGIFHITKIAVYSDLLKTIEHKIFYTGDYGHADFADITEYVLAWMPLPEPYKAEGGGEE